MNLLKTRNGAGLSKEGDVQQQRKGCEQHGKELSKKLRWLTKVKTGWSPIDGRAVDVYTYGNPRCDGSLARLLRNTDLDYLG